MKIGIEAVGWRQSDADSTREYGAVTGVILFHPDPNGPVYLSVGFGAGRYAEDGSGDLLNANGFVTVFGGGADFRISDKITVGPYIRYLFSNDLDQTVNRLAQVSTLDFNMLQIGAGARWH